jgi:outer membrane immunogenic protein
MGVPPIAPPAPVYNWTGWYVGVNAGASMGNVKTDFNFAPVTLCIDAICRPGPGRTASNTESPDGFIGGGQIGYNWQWSPLIVVGLEADIQGALEKDHNTLTDPFSRTTPEEHFRITGTAVTDYETKIDWFGTVRARVGYLWGDGNVMTYLTGGLAYGEVDIEGTNTVNGSVTSVATKLSTPFSLSHAVGHSHLNTGWVLGYGTEGRLATPGWTWRVESYYMDLGHLDDTDSVEPPSVTASGGQVTSHTHFTDWILRGGLSYQFH